MVVKELQESVRMVGQAPVLWIPGIVAGLLGAVLWILFNLAGTFFTSRLVIIAGLVMVLFVAGIFGLIKKNETGAGTMVREGVGYYFRVLLPWLVILFILLLVFALIMMVTIISTGGSTDYEGTGLLAVFVMIPTLFLTFFCDTAAVFEDLRVFASLRRSIGVVAGHAWEVLGFFVTCVVLSFLDFFVFALIWEGLLFDKLQPLVDYYNSSAYNETQFASMLTPQQLVNMIGPDGMWITAAVIFLAVVFLVPLLLAFKACFYRSMIGSPVATVQQMTGEFDSKGRWYKY
jgi:hypothetical protein